MVDVRVCADIAAPMDLEFPRWNVSVVRSESNILIGHVLSLIPVIGRSNDLERPILSDRY
jgi:hypothetical protein